MVMVTLARNLESLQFNIKGMIEMSLESFDRQLIVINFVHRQVTLLKKMTDEASALTAVYSILAALLEIAVYFSAVTLLRCETLG